MATLRPGLQFDLQGCTYRVTYVNASRAHCVPVERKTVTVPDRRQPGGVRTFTAPAGDPINISANAVVDPVEHV